MCFLVRLTMASVLFSGALPPSPLLRTWWSKIPHGLPSRTLGSPDRAPRSVEENYRDANQLHGRTWVSSGYGKLCRYAEGRASIRDANPIPGQNTLFTGSPRGHFGVVRLLLDIGADIETSGFCGLTPCDFDFWRVNTACHIPF